MKTNTKPTPALSKTIRGWAVLLLTSLALSGCVTRHEVARIVTQSNAAMLAGQFDLPAAGPTGQTPAWQQASDRIEAFITEHPGQPATTAPLRIRQAMLLLAHGQFSLAQAAFNAASLDDLHSDRDKALKRSEATLLWWFANSTNATWSTSDQTQAQKALAQLKEEQDSLADSPGIRDYLAEMRAWIGLSAAKQATSVDKARAAVVDALDIYAAIFTPEDLASLSQPPQTLPGSDTLTTDVRRRLRARAVLQFARDINRQNSLAAHPTTEAFNRFIN